MFVTNIFLFLLLTIITLIKGRSTITQTLTETVEDSPVITTTLYQITPLKATKNIKSTIIETSTEFVPNRYHAKVKTIIQEKMNTDTITRTITMNYCVNDNNLPSYSDIHCHKKQLSKHSN
jgi:hypothetical protein